MGPPSEDTRPTTDKVREAIFNALASALAIEDARVLDLFAGTGACGIEALSRGARSVTFVENDRRALEVLKTNLESLSISSAATVVRGSVLPYLANAEAFDVVFADPPYRFESWTEVLGQVQASVLVCESNRPIPSHPRWTVTREKRYGTTLVTFLEPTEAAKITEVS